MIDVNLCVRGLGTMTHSLCSNLVTWQESCVEIYFVHWPMSGPFTTTVIYVVRQGQALKSPCSCLNGMECCIIVCMCSCQLHTQSFNSALSGPSRSDRRTRAINHGSNQPVSQASCMSQYANNHMQRSKQTRQMDKGSNSATVVQVLFYPLYVMNDSVLRRTFPQCF